MVYAYDRNILMPTKDLYDTQIMAMALNVAKDEYNKAEKRLDDLTKLYSDFYSPSDVDMANWQRVVVDPIKNQIDDLYTRGIDPLRSAEGRALLAKVSRNLPYDDINTLKQTAKTGQKYLENMAELQAKGLYDPDYETRYLGYDIKNWDSLDPKNGVWNRYSPDPVPSLQDATVGWYKNRTPRQLTPEEVSASGLQYDPRYDYTGYLNSDLLNVAGENVPGFIGTQVGGYYADLAKRELENEAIAAGVDPRSITQKDINNRLARNIAAANRQYLIGPVGEVNPFVLDDYKTKNDIRAYQQKHNIDRLDNDGTNAYEQSYARDMYTTSIGKLFNTDMYAASKMIYDGSAGKNIFNREEKILKDNGYDVDKCVAAHTSRGYAKSNAALLDIPLGGSTGSTSSKKTLNSSLQFTKESLAESGQEIYDGADLVFDTAGYRPKEKNRTKEQSKNNKLLKSANYYTVTQENFGHLNKNGRYLTYVKVIGNNGSVGYVRARVDSNTKASGQSYSSIAANRDQDLGYNASTIGSIKQRDLVATKLYTKAGDANNNAAVEPDYDVE